MAAPDPGSHNVPNNPPDSSRKSDMVGLSHWYPAGETWQMMEGEFFPLNI